MFLKKNKKERKRIREDAQRQRDGQKLKKHKIDDKMQRQNKRESARVRKQGRNNSKEIKRKKKKENEQKRIQ